MRKFLMITVLSISLLNTVQSASTPEQVKTLLVFNFIKFMEWEDKSTTLNIAFIGKDETLYKAFQEMVEQRTIGGKKLTLQKVTNVSEAAKFHVVYLAESNSSELQQIPSTLNTVVITEKEGSAKHGSFINLITIEGKLRFEINKSKFEASKVKISNQLISLAILV